MKTCRHLTLAVALAQAAAGATARECWTLGKLTGQSALSSTGFAFNPDRYATPITLCFEDNRRGTVSGDDTPFVQLSPSTLVGASRAGELEQVEVFQLDRAHGRVSFTRSRIGSSSLMSGIPDVIGVYTGTATPLATP
jgi:hypothetical protein